MAETNEATRELLRDVEGALCKLAVLKIPPPRKFAIKHEGDDKIYIWMLCPQEEIEKVQSIYPKICEILKRGA